MRSSLTPARYLAAASALALASGTALASETPGAPGSDASMGLYYISMVTVFMLAPPNRGHLIGNHVCGACAPGKEPFHSVADAPPRHPGAMAASEQTISACLKAKVGVNFLKSRLKLVRLFSEKQGQMPTCSVCVGWSACGVGICICVDGRCEKRRAAGGWRQFAAIRS